jgi:predicted ATPase
VRKERGVSVLILTGPSGAGKNTIAVDLARKLDRCVVIDVDLVRWMVVRPHIAPWDGEEGRLMLQLGARNACLLANSFLDAGFDVVILDVLLEETAQIYRAELRVRNLPIVLLLPTFAEIRKRTHQRGPRLKEEEVELLYLWQCNFNAYSLKIDNTNLPAEEVAERLTSIVQRASPARL